eukprot:3401886-Prymnesium_polylepis.1
MLILRTEIWATVCLCNVHGAAGWGGALVLWDEDVKLGGPPKCRLPAHYRTSVKIECRFEGPKVALRRHSTGTTRSPHGLVNDAEKIRFGS